MSLSRITKAATASGCMGGLYFPDANASAHALAATAALRAWAVNRSGASIKVFLADDHAVLREGLSQLLGMQPDLHVVGAAADGASSLRMIAELKPDVAVLDISMPGIDGIEMARQLGEQGGKVGVVMLSVHDSMEYVYRALAVGARGYLQKESAACEIVDAIRAVHAGRRYLSSRIAALVAEQVGRPTRKTPLESLSARERQVLQLVAEGHSSAQIGEQLHLSSKTVDTYRSRLMQKLGLADLVSLVKFAVRHGMVSLAE